MRRAARIFFHAAAAVSGVLLLVAVGFWIASYGSAYMLTVGSVRSARNFTVSRGTVRIAAASFGAEGERVASPVVEWIWDKDPPYDLAGAAPYSVPGGRRTIAGFAFHRVDIEGMTGFRLLLPLPGLVALFAPLPLADVILIRRRRRRRRRVAAGLCVRCGYDLRATPEKCPECGAVPNPRVARLPEPGG